MTSSGRRRTIGIMVLLILVGPFLVDWLITTEEERVEAVVETSVEAVGRQDAATLAGQLSADFEDDTGLLLRNLSRQGAEIAIEAALERMNPRIEVDRVEIEVDGDRATLDFTGGVQVEAPWAGRQVPARVELRCELVREDDGEWRYRRLLSLEVGRGGL